MATSTMKIQPGTLSLHTYNTYRDMMTMQAPNKKPVCQKYQKGECSGKCPYFHPQNLPPQSAPLKTTPTTPKQPWKPTQNPTKPPTQPAPSTSTQTPPGPPKKDEKPVSTAIVPERPGQKIPSVSPRHVKSKTSQVSASLILPPRQSRSSTVVSGSQTESQVSNSDDSMVPRVKNSKSTPNSVSTRPQKAASCSVAISAATPRSVEPAPMQETPSSPSTSRTSPLRKNGSYEKKKFEKPENPRTEVPLSPKSASPEQVSIPESSPAQCDQRAVVPPPSDICRNYLHKRCSQNPCPYYHDPGLAKLPPLCERLYDGPCNKKVCEFYHPENDRYRMVCINALRSRCTNHPCRRFHFRLPRRDAVAPVKRDSPALALRDGTNMHPPSPPTNPLLPSTLSTHGSDIGLSQSQCPAWNDGYCPKGMNCKMLHLPPVVRWRMEAEQAAAKTIDRMIFDNTKVVFGAGCEIKEVTTALESCRVLISNLPARTTKGELENFLTSVGFNRETFHILILRLSADKETQEASVIFKDTRHAKTVVEVLDKQKYYDVVLKFELAPAVTQNQMDDWTYNRSSYLEVSFNAPSKRAQAVYPSVEAAIEKAKALNGRYLGGRIVHVTVARKPDENETWTFIKNSIIISNIAPKTPDSEIMRFAKPFSIGTFGVRRFYVPAVLQGLKEHMQTIGDLKPHDFDVIQDYQRGTILARARFDTWGKADNVYQSLQEKELDFLTPTHARFFLAFPHQYSLHIPLEHYDAQKEVYNRLEGQHRRDKTAHIVATRYRTVCLIQVVGVDKKAVGALKLKVEKIARGEVVEVWDRFFLNWQGEAFFGRLLRQFDAYVRPDRTRQVLRVYGSEAAVNHARREIKEQMKTLAALDFQMNIEDYLVGFFIRKGMLILGDMLGEDNVWLHTTSKPYFVSVRGGHDAEHALRELVGEARNRPPPILDWSQSCPLCFEEPTQPLPLPCQHIYCAGCLKHTLNAATDGSSIPICCIGDAGRCKTLIPLPVIERFISPALLTQMFENTFRVYLEQRPNEFRFCSTPDCTQIYRASKENSMVIQCPACLVETCSHCHKSPHRGLTCEENTLIGSKSGQELLLERWAKGNSNVKKCPDCGVFIEKIAGCNHIHCRCGGHVCWICVQSFNHGIYDHLNAVHGGAYDADRL